MEPDKRNQILELAREHHREGDLELDEDSKVSEGDGNGAYVQMWKWVSFEDTRLCKDGFFCTADCPVHGG